jgi:hypothetical protein
MGLEIYDKAYHHGCGTGALDHIDDRDTSDTHPWLHYAGRLGLKSGKRNLAMVAATLSDPEHWINHVSRRKNPSRWPVRTVSLTRLRCGFSFSNASTYRNVK